MNAVSPSGHVILPTSPCSNKTTIHVLSTIVTKAEDHAFSFGSQDSFSSASTPHQSAGRETVDKALIITKLQQENQQLRRELNDAYHRIRELEGNLALMVVSSTDDDDDDDNLSVEVQSVMSIMSLTNSSASTIPTGSPLANEIREQQQTRDDQETLKNHRKANRALSSRLVDRHWRRHKKQVAPMISNDRNHPNHHRDPSGVLMHTPSSRYTTADPLATTTLKRVASGASDPRLDHLSSVSEDSSDHHAGRSMVGRLLVMPRQTSDDVSTFTSGYFMRVDSSDDMDSLVEI